ncbi:putative lactosylceramide 4-alpha-galactosyltransferase [Dioscorea sansibarensis]
MIFKLFFKLSSMSSMANHSPKPKKPLSLLFLLLPTSFTFAFLIIALINGTLISFFSLPSTSINELKPSSSPLMNIPIFISKQRSSMNNMDPKKMMIINSKLKFLKPNKHSKHFSTRVSKFINSSCNPLFFMTWLSSSSSTKNFGPRELLSMESVFKFHPNACLLIVSNSMDTPKGARILKPYKDQGFKVSAISPDYHYFSTFLFSQTPAESWFKKLIQGSIDPGEVSLAQNMSNLLRLAILYKFGGIYLDTDVILMKSLHGLENVIGAQTLDVHGNWSRLNNAVMIFSKGHPLVLKFIEEFVETFDGKKWGYNGPYLVSRVVGRVAGKPGLSSVCCRRRRFIRWGGGG